MNDRTPTLATERVKAWLDGRDAAHPLQQPGGHNALSVDMWEAVPPLLAQARATIDVRAGVLRRGREGLRLRRRHLAVRGHARRARGGERYEAMAEATLMGIHDLRKPTLARIRGYCIGGGVNVAISCDIRIASTDSVFSIPAARLGLGYRYSAMKNLVDLIGPGRAKDLFFTARRLDAAEALALGLVSRVCRRRPARAAGRVRAMGDQRAAHGDGRQGDHPRDP